jgi:hypothetical protein
MVITVEPPDAGRMIGWLWDRLRLRKRLGLARGERVLESRRGADGERAVVATDRGIYLRRHGDGWIRLGWEHIVRVSWDEPAGGLVVAGRTGRSAIPVRGPGTLLELARDRVIHTRLGRWRVLSDGRTVVVEARRRVGTGQVLWFADSPGAELDAVITQLSMITGIDPPNHRAASVR